MVSDPIKFKQFCFEHNLWVDVSRDLGFTEKTSDRKVEKTRLFSVVYGSLDTLDRIYGHVATINFNFETIQLSSSRRLNIFLSRNASEKKTRLETLEILNKKRNNLRDYLNKAPHSTKHTQKQIKVD